VEENRDTDSPQQAANPAQRNAPSPSTVVPDRISGEELSQDKRIYNAKNRDFLHCEKQEGN
jgi:hypothetical protein